jgi:hypothetical protein
VKTPGAWIARQFREVQRGGGASQPVLKGDDLSYDVRVLQGDAG